MNLHLAQHGIKVLMVTAATELDADGAEVGKPACTQDNKQCSGPEGDGCVLMLACSKHLAWMFAQGVCMQAYC